MDVASVDTKPIVETMSVVYVLRNLLQLRAFLGWVFQSETTVNGVGGSTRIVCDWDGDDIVVCKWWFDACWWCRISIVAEVGCGRVDM